jgi:type II restriction enzyme
MGYLRVHCAGIMKLGFEESQTAYNSGSQSARAWTEAWVAATARRAGWIGSNILLNRVSESGKIHIVQNGTVRAKELVLAEWQKTLFLRNESPDTRGWLLDVMKCVESLGKRDFTLDDVYAFERHLGDLHPGNQNVKPKIRQQLQYLRDRGFIDFVSRGNYRLRS